MELIKIIYYETESGKNPFREWLLKLDTFNRSIVDTRLKRFILGNYGDCKLPKGADGLWKLRVDCGPGYRVYFGKDGQKLVVLLVGGDKKANKRIEQKRKILARL